MELTIITSLAAAVILGSLTISRWARRFQLSTSVLAVAFTVTAMFWLALLIAAIGITVRTFALASA